MKGEFSMNVTEQKFGYDEKSGIGYDGPNSIVLTGEAAIGFASVSISLYQKFHRETPEECYLLDLLCSIQKRAYAIDKQKGSLFYSTLIFHLMFIFPMLTNDTLLKKIEALLEIESQGKCVDLVDVYRIITVLDQYANVASIRTQKLVNSFFASKAHQKSSLRYKYMNKLEPIFKEILKKELNSPDMERNGRNSPFAHIFRKKIISVLTSIPEMGTKKRNKNGVLESSATWKIRQYKAMIKLYATWRKKQPELGYEVMRLKDYFEKTLWKKLEFCTNITPESLPTGLDLGYNENKEFNEWIKKMLSAIESMP